MVHDADFENEKFGRKEAIGIDLMLKGLAHMEKSSNEILFDRYCSVYIPLSRTQEQASITPADSCCQGSTLMAVMHVRIMRACGKEITIRSGRQT